MNWEEHKPRLFYGGLAVAFAAVFVGMAYINLPTENGAGDWIGAAKTILIGLAMLCYNKARGGEKPKDG